MWAPYFKLSPFALHGQKTSIPNRNDRNKEERKQQKCAGGGAVGGDCIQLHYSGGYVKIKVDRRVHVGSMWWRESKKKKELIN